MKSKITYEKTSEQEELEKKLAELSALQAELTERELELVTLQGELHAFEREYLQVIGTRYAELDEIEAEIAKYLAVLNPNDSTAQKQAEEAWTRAEESKRATEDNLKNQEFSRDFKPWESLKKLYREVAKLIHPDLTTDEVERLRRQKIMAEVNQAYENGNEKRLTEILQGWQNKSESVKDQSSSTELLRVIREIVQVSDRLKVIKCEIKDFELSEIYQIRNKAINAKQENRDLLTEMASKIDKQIAKAKIKLEKFKSEVSK
ncbi:hypothetical protein LC653_41215 [Nostoc sp. CHAB 5784]|uniref:hypothetical protein n=1 Tax=Nostoc mirabile TaxID=2907820 RepID=UPI001E28E117|nr:hypothetical protein [Nostoc mirabile]MCC5670047.1 hypothetical protein [Nostoc mirabile CHAB5784]